MAHWRRRPLGVERRLARSRDRRMCRRGSHGGSVSRNYIKREFATTCTRLKGFTGGWECGGGDPGEAWCGGWTALAVVDWGAVERLLRGRVSLIGLVVAAI